MKGITPKMNVNYSVRSVNPWLLVEDEPDIREMLLAVFDIWQIRCIVHQSGEETLEWLNGIDHYQAEDLPELALIDIRLVSELDGITVASKLRSTPELKDIVIVLNTAYTLTEQEKQQCLRLSGADHVMSKPLPRFEKLYEELSALKQKKLEVLQRSSVIAGSEYKVNEIGSEEPGFASHPNGSRQPATIIRQHSVGKGVSRQAQKLLQYAVLAVSGGAFISIVSLALSVIPLVGREGSLARIYTMATQYAFILGTIIALLGLWLIVRAYQRKNSDSFLANEIANKLCTQFDSRFSLVTNFNHRGLRGVDAIIAGPPGLLVLRFLNLSGNLFQERGYWLIQGDRGELRPLRNNLTKELLSDILKVKARLNEKKLSGFPVFGAVLSVNSSDMLQYHSNGEIFPLVFTSSIADSLHQQFLSRDRVTLRAARKATEHLHLPAE